MKTAAAVLLCLAAMALVACGGGGEPATTASSTPATTPATTAEPTDTAATGDGATGAYPEAARQSFLSACTASADKEQCECALDYLEKNVPIDELVKAGLESDKGGEMPKVLADAVAECT